MLQLNRIGERLTAKMIVCNDINAFGLVGEFFNPVIPLVEFFGGVEVVIPVVPACVVPEPVSLVAPV